MYSARGIKCKYYAWDKRSESKRTIENKSLLSKIQDIHNKLTMFFRDIRVTQIINKEADRPINVLRSLVALFFTQIEVISIVLIYTIIL